MKTQGNKRVAILGLYHSFLWFVGAVVLLVVAIISSKEFNGFYLLCIVSETVSICSFAFGIFELIKYKKNKDFHLTATKSSCRVKKVRRELYSGSKNDIFGYYMVVEYIGDSGKKYSQIVNIGHKDFKKIKKGDYIECLVKGESCYVDQDNICLIEEKEA